LGSNELPLRDRDALKKNNLMAFLRGKINTFSTVKAQNSTFRLIVIQAMGNLHVRVQAGSK